MKIGYDLDGTLDKEPVRKLALALAKEGHEVHVITGMFPDGQSWQGVEAKIRKMKRLGFRNFTYNMTRHVELEYADGPLVFLHILEAQPVSPTRNLEYVLRDLGLRKGALIEELGIELMFDDSATYCEMVRRTSGATTALIQ